jgi:hypothetical protein
LGGGLHVLLEEVWVDGLDVGGVDIDQGGGAFGFIFVDTADIGGAAVEWLVQVGCMDTEQCGHLRLVHC